MYGDSNKWFYKCIDAAKNIPKKTREEYIKGVNNSGGMEEMAKKLSLSNEEAVGIMLLWCNPLSSINKK